MSPFFITPCSKYEIFKYSIFRWPFRTQEATFEPFEKHHAAQTYLIYLQPCWFEDVSEQIQLESKVRFRRRLTD